MPGLSNLESHAERLYSVATAPERRLAKPLLTRLIDWPKDKPIRVRSIAEKGWSGLDDAETVAAVMDLLIDTAWVRPVPVVPTGGGRPTQDFVVHPQAAEHLKASKSRTHETHETSGAVVLRVLRVTIQRQASNSQASPWSKARG